MVQRLADNIRLLAEKANDYHQSVFKENDVELVTRVLTSEFSFYPERPLSLDEYQQLLQKIRVIANKYNNIHLLLSSFAVKTHDNRLLNVVCYIECKAPNEPKITSLCKRWNAADIDYEGKFLPFEPFSTEHSDFFMYKMTPPQKLDEHSLKIIPYTRAFILQENDIYFIDKNRKLIVPLIQNVDASLKYRYEQIVDSDPRIQNPQLNEENDQDYILYTYMYEASIFCAEHFSPILNRKLSPNDQDVANLTADLDKSFILSNAALFEVEVGEQSYYQGIEICVEHALMRLPLLTEQLFTNQNEDFIPKRVNHLLTSNSTNLTRNKDYPVAKDGNATQIDAKVKASEGKLLKRITRVTNPPFGADYTIIPSALEKVGDFSDNLLSKIQAHNEHVMEKKIEAIMKEPEPRVPINPGL